jgi:hypothetical protein
MVLAPGISLRAGPVPDRQSGAIERLIEAIFQAQGKAQLLRQTDLLAEAFHARIIADEAQLGGCQR